MSIPPTLRELSAHGEIGGVDGQSGLGAGLGMHEEDGVGDGCPGGLKGGNEGGSLLNLAVLLLALRGRVERTEMTRQRRAKPAVKV